MRTHTIKQAPGTDNILYPQSELLLRLVFLSFFFFQSQNDTILCVHLMAWPFAQTPTWMERLLSMLLIEDTDMNKTQLSSKLKL